MLRKHIKAEKESFPRFASLLKAYRELLKAGDIEKQPWLEQLLIKRAIRTLSGVAPVHVMTAPLGCPANCLYCPTEPGMPKSYLSSQPGAMRAILNDFDPYRQVKMRLRALYQNGHHPEKIELIENGATWGALPKRYRTWFITRCFEAANNFKPEEEEDTTDFIPASNNRLFILNKLKNQPDHLQKDSLRLQDEDDSDLLPALFEAQKINETAKHRLIGITIETRPDWLSDEEIVHLRNIGCTKIELGVQNIYEEVLKANNRGHDIDTIKNATERLRDAGFKVAYHIMPAMYKSTPEMDIKMFDELFSDPGFKPDFLKVYPCVVLKQAHLYKLWERGEYKPYDAETLLKVLVEIKKRFPRYCRVARLVRDIPSDMISDGNKITNLREMVQKEIKKQGIKCQCIRCREVMGDVKDEELVFDDFQYETINGTEHFLTYSGKDSDNLYAFLRLRLPKSDQNSIFPELSDCALIRELHTYGKLARLSHTGKACLTPTMQMAQHKGLGRKLMDHAEKLAQKSGHKKTAVISGVGTREYYKKLGYKLEQTYMIKEMQTM